MQILNRIHDTSSHSSIRHHSRTCWLFSKRCTHCQIVNKCIHYAGKLSLIYLLNNNELRDANKYNEYKYFVNKESVLSKYYAMPCFLDSATVNNCDVLFRTHFWKLNIASVAQRNAKQAFLLQSTVFVSVGEASEASNKHMSHVAMCCVTTFCRWSI